MALNPKAGEAYVIGPEGSRGVYHIRRRYSPDVAKSPGLANIRALELLRMPAPRYQGCELYRNRIQGVLDRLPEGLSKLRDPLGERLDGDFTAIAITLKNQNNSTKYARKLLHRISQTLAFALLCEAASEAHRNGNSLPAHCAWRYYEEIEPPAIGSEDETARREVLQNLLEETQQVPETVNG